MQTNVYTPWGAADHIQEIAEGITMYSTASHGGMRISEARLEQMPKALRDGEWYEHDCAICRVITAFPDVFSEKDFAEAKEGLKNWLPDVYEAHFNEIIPEGQSYMKDQRIFQERHKDDWVGISAIGDAKGMVRVTATKGGARACPENGFNHPEEREFAVPEQEYRNRSHCGFVVDPEKHMDFNTWEKLEFAKSWKASAIEAITANIDGLVLKGNIEGAYRMAKGLAVLESCPDHWWADHHTRSNNPGLLAQQATPEWDIATHGPVKIPVPPEAPFQVQGDKTLYHGITGEPMEPRYRGIAIVVCQGEPSVFGVYPENGERCWTAYGPKAELESGAFSAYLAKIGPEEEARFWALKNPTEAEELLPEKKSAMPKM